jgi:hypothetical protein
MKLVSAIAAHAALTISSMPSLAGDDVRTFTLRQEKPVLTDINLGSNGKSHGDMLAFEAAVSGNNGLKGTMSGLLITVDIAEGEEDFEDRIGQIVFDMGNGDSLVVSGRSIYKGTNQEIDAGAPQLRAVIGGTGAYMGARGQITTTRNADGTYDHRIELLGN